MRTFITSVVINLDQNIQIMKVPMQINVFGNPKSQHYEILCHT